MKDFEVTKMKKGRPMITKERMIKEVREAYKKHGPFFKGEINKLTSFCKESVLNRFNTLEELASEANITFKTKKGIPKSEEHRKKISNCFKGKTIEERLGKEKAKERNNKISIKLKGNKNNKLYVARQDIIMEIQKKYQMFGAFKKCEFNKFIESCNVVTARNKFGSLDKLALEAKIKFKHHKMFRPNQGHNENEILDKIEGKIGRQLIRQFYVAGKFIDGYDPIDNIAYEVDEDFHRYRILEDIKREQKIINIINCDFVRIRGEINE